MHNDITIVGYMTRDPELKQVGTDGIDVANFGVAVNRGFSKNEAVDFFNITCWRGLAATVAANKKKGDLVLVQGEMNSDQYEKDGQKRTSWYITARTVRFFPRGTGGDNANVATSQTTDNDNDFEDDDIPF